MTVKELKQETGWPINDVRRWTKEELDQLQHRLNRDGSALAVAASNAIGSLRFDLVDVRHAMSQP